MGNQCYTIQLIEHHAHSQTPCAILNSPALPWLETKSCKQDVSGMVLVCEGKLLECMIDQLPSFFGINLSTKHIPTFQARLPPKSPEAARGIFAIVGPAHGRTRGYHGPNDL